MKIIRIILAIVVFVLAVLAFINRHSTDINLIPYMLIGFGILYMFDAIDFYKLNRKIYSMLMAAFSLFMIIIGIFTF
ncbi:hypothetical protein [Senegalia sp. (in: firmicutes)]|uniref:hypothetical protein n=1 Tax=Senegalia sp. (in: firmicutes) TaxID=1924098 RepID=UPI003F95A2B4